MTQETKDFFDKVQNTAYTMSTTARGLTTIQQTQRNKLKAQAMEILQDMIAESLAINNPDNIVNLDTTADGIAISVYNDSLEQEVVFIVNLSIPALANNGVAYDVAFEAEEYRKQQIEKAESKQAKAKAKADKAKRDAELRAQAKRNLSYNPSKED